MALTFELNGLSLLQLIKKLPTDPVVSIAEHSQKF